MREESATAASRLTVFIARAGDHGPRSPAPMPHSNITHMTTRIRVTKDGRVTLPLVLCRKLGLDKMRTPTVVVEERDGGLFLRPAPPVRNIPQKRIKDWIARGEVEVAPSRAKAPGTKANIPLPASHRAKLDRRLKSLAKDPESGRPCPEVRRKLLAGVSLGEQLSDLRGALRTRQPVKTLRKFGRNRA